MGDECRWGHCECWWDGGECCDCYNRSDEGNDD